MFAVGASSCRCVVLCVMFSGKQWTIPEPLPTVLNYGYRRPMIMSISAVHWTCNIFDLYFYTAYAAHYIYIAMQRNLKKYRNLAEKHNLGRNKINIQCTYIDWKMTIIQKLWVKRLGLISILTFPSALSSKLGSVIGEITIIRQTHM